VSSFWQSTINELVLPKQRAQIEREFSFATIELAISMTKNIIEEKQWSSMPLDLVYYICRILKRHPKTLFEDICQQLSLLPRYTKLAQDALTRYKEYSAAFKRFSEFYDTVKISFEIAFIAFAKSNYKIAYFRPYGDCNIQAIIEVLIDPNNQLTSLDLSHADIDDVAAEKISYAMTDLNCKLTVLNLSNNKIDEQGAQAIADCVRDLNCKLTVLNLHSNGIGGKGVQAIADALGCCMLRSLDLACNSINDSGIEVLADVEVVLKHNGRPISIDCGSYFYSGYLEQAENKYKEYRVCKS
jgi:hypothetical protein